MVAPYPDLSVRNGESQDMIYEWLDLARAFGYAKYVEEKFFDDAQVWLFVEGGVEGEDGPGAFEAVACEMEFLHCMY